MQVLKDLLRDTRFRFGFIVLLVLLTLSILSFFSPYNPYLWNQVPRDLPPHWPHILGTNSMGQDIFWKLTFAVRNSLVMSLIAGLVSRIIAMIVGMIAGYKGGAADRVLTFLSDSFLVIPLFIIIVLVASIVKGRLSLPMLGLLLGVFGWAWDARVIRSQVLSLRERDFTYTALLSGSKALSIVFKEYLPFLIPLIFATLIGNMSWAIGMEITLAILGVSNLDIPTLGTMLQWSINYQALLLGYWWWVLTPVLTSIFLFIALYLISISISEYLDPRMRIQRIGQA
ncbi:MAG: Oligopeptide ABC transporter, permease protein [Thermotoga sp. 47_83]|nr:MULTISPECIES: ABC transporter permease [Thermotoga]KUK33204.1 MAG: Oligopeptide ABC transporter, permease protein [Thermotoga sp. 47_83]ABQ46870.1 binding-protein-dependent transport systems inner membrane component [Thermotoga petrophila RKU-1]AGL48996.1 Xylobiose ABC transport system, permease protein 2 [Thermotoga maritima MSB8]AHD18157.1 peptide ABC transporter [Thermotoga maritima MSB8]AKE26019.1 peptide ABC transporter [Thermotoga maritima]